MRQDVSDYIKDMLSRGYSRQQAISELLKLGYSTYEIDEQFRRLSPRHFHFSARLIIIMVVMFAIAGAFVYIFYPEIGDNSPALYTTLDIRRAEFARNMLSFTLDMLSTKRIEKPVTVNYLLEDNSRKTIIEGSEQIHLDNRIYKVISLRLPETLKDGIYKLRVSVIVNGKMISSEKDVSFHNEGLTDNSNNSNNSEKNTIPVIPPDFVCDDRNQCTRDYTEERTCVHEQLIPCCGNSVCEAVENQQNCDSDCINVEKPLTREEIYSMARELIPAYPEKAVTYCRQLIFITDRDFCYNNVAQGSKDSRCCLVIDSNIKKDECFSLLANSTQEPALCGSVKSDSTRDKCNVQFIVAGDYSLCTMLTDERLKETCRLLER